jgi:FkbM family methyltransferase
MRKSKRRGKAPGPGLGEVVSVWPRGLSRPVRARLGTSDFMVIEDLLVHGGGGADDGRGEYDAAMDAAARVCGGADKVGLVLDLGANIGIAAVMFADRFPEARVVAVEPEAENFKLLEMNTGSVDGSRTRCVRACVGATRRTVVLDRSAHGGEPWAIAMKDGAGEDRVDVVTVEDVCATRADAIDLLKCDIEGAERELFESCGGWIARVRVMVVELHAPYREAEFLEHVRRGCGGAMPFAAQKLREDHAIQVLLLERTGQGGATA